MRKTNKFLAASAVAIMLAPAALSALPQQNVDASAVGTISTTTPVYDSTGKATGATLPSGSQWQLGQQITLNGVAHYQVATNEYVPASVVTNVTGSANPSDTTNSIERYVSENPDAGKVATANTLLHVVDAYGNETSITLAAGSQWKIGSILHANKMTYYQVSTNEFIPTTDVTVAGAATSTTTGNGSYITDGSTAAGKIGTATANVQIVNGSGTATGAVLPKGSQWKLGSKTLNYDKQTYYQVATDEYVSVAYMNVAGDTATNNTTNSNGFTVSTDSNAGKVAKVTNSTTIFDDQGNNTGVAMPAGGYWKVGQVMKDANGVTYYQIATNQWLQVGDIYIAGATENQTSENGSYMTTDSSAAGQTGTVVTNNAKILNGAGIATGATLAKGTQWKIGPKTLHYSKVTYYQIASDEYVSVVDMQVNSGTNTNTTSSVPTPGNGLVATTNVEQKTYNTATNAYDMVLPANTSWKITKLVVNKYGSYWGQVATNQWVWLSNVTLNSGLNLKDNSYYEPEFATSINK